jgi:tetrapyrrole methylase family protein / MazG family protein
MDRFERAGAAFAKLCRTMHTLRAPGGCPWDREQTLDSLKPYLIEEMYETLDAIDSGDADKHREELGDLLLQIVFQSELTAEAGKFDAGEVAEGIDAKLVRRHPHVFGGEKADSASGALKKWEQMKAAERSSDASRLDGVPRAMPALLRALRTGEKAASIGFDWRDVPSVAAKVEEEWDELRALGDGGEAQAKRRDEELGDLLFAICQLSRHLGLDPEAALTRGVDKFHRRFRYIEKRLSELGREPGKVSLDELEGLWQEAKSREPGARPE